MGSQKDLATKICEKPQIVTEYEQGKAIPNQQILAKMERALGMKLRGKDKGKPLEAKEPKAQAVKASGQEEVRWMTAGRHPAHQHRFLIIPNLLGGPSSRRQSISTSGSSRSRFDPNLVIHPDAFTSYFR